MRPIAKSLLCIATLAALALGVPVGVPVGAIAGDAPVARFSLTDHTGRAVDETTYRGRLMLVFFGYTHCPDVCPTTLNDVSVALDMLGDRADRIAPLFISVDPARDTPGILAEYVAVFDPRIIGLTGSKAEIRAAADAFLAFYAIPEPAPAHGEHEEHEETDYVVDHSAFVYLMDERGAYLDHFAFGVMPEKMVDRILRRLDETDEADRG